MNEALVSDLRIMVFVASSGVIFWLFSLYHRCQERTHCAVLWERGLSCGSVAPYTPTLREALNEGV